MIKRIHRGFNMSTRKDTRYYDSLSIPYIEPSLFRGYQTVAIINLLFRCLGEGTGRRRNVLPPSIDGKLPNLLSLVLALLSQQMFC